MVTSKQIFAGSSQIAYGNMESYREGESERYKNAFDKTTIEYSAFLNKWESAVDKRATKNSLSLPEPFLKFSCKRQKRIIGEYEFFSSNQFGSIAIFCSAKTNKKIGDQFFLTDFGQLQNIYCCQLFCTYKKMAFQISF